MFYLSNFRIYALLLFSTLTLVLLASGCAPTQKQRGQAGESSEEHAKEMAALSAPPDFVGDAACANCHSAEFKDHKATHHAVTLREMTRTGLGELAPTTEVKLPEHALATVRLSGNNYRVATPQGTSESLQFAFGSGKSGMTFVSVLPGSSLFEMRASYFPHQKQWKVTPGQRGLEPEDTGVEHEGEEARRCIACHTTTLPSFTLMPEKRFYSVGCEACHGPASTHVTAMQSVTATAQQSLQKKDLHIERIGDWGARQVNELCGRCHRVASALTTLKPGVPDLRVVSRFQPYALMLSRCFKESNNSLSCNTCHNPHQNTAHDKRVYEAACLNCHRGKGEGNKERHEIGNAPHLNIRTPERTASASVPDAQHAMPPSPGKSCPVNPRADCIRCHMPTTQVLQGSMVNTAAPDHFIRVHRPSREAQWAREVKNALLLNP